MGRYIQQAQLSSSEQRNTARTAADYTLPAIYEIYNDAVDGALSDATTYYWEIPEQVNFNKLTLEMDFSANVAVYFRCTTYQELSNADDTGWKDCTEMLVGEGETVLTGPISDMFRMDIPWKFRLMIKAVVTGAGTTFRAQAVQ